MSIIDWIILFTLFAALMSIGFVCKKLIKGIADFLVAGRSVGRYLGLGSGSLVGFGAVSTLAIWQMIYKSGFVGSWFWSFQFPLAIFIALTGFAICRFRQTRAMTIPQMLEMRFSKSLRVFSGLLIFVSGVINMGVFPAIGARFFVYFCGLPQTITIMGGDVATYIPVMLVLVAAAVVICFLGGQVTLVITDFFQNIFVNFTLVAIVIFVVRTISFDQFSQTFTATAESRAMIIPFHEAAPKDFGVMFYIFQLFWMIYLVVTWSPDTMQVSSSKDAKEAKLMRAMVSFRVLVGTLLGMFLLPIAAYTIMNNADFSSLAQEIMVSVEGVENPHIRSQILVPAAISRIIPIGLTGAFAAMMLFAFISTNDTFMLAFSSVLIQDVIIPVRGKPLSPKTHLIALRLSVVFVAVAVVVFSVFFKISDNIFMFMALSGSIYTAGAGIVILAGLYWHKGSSKAAWITMITGTLLSTFGFIYRYKINTNFPMDGYQIGISVSIICIILYFSASLLEKNYSFDLSTLFKDDAGNTYKTKFKFSKLLHWTENMTKTDSILFWSMVAFTGLYVLLSASVLVIHLIIGMSAEFWMAFWKYYLVSMFLFGVCFLLWITVGGFLDIRSMFSSLRNQELDEEDNGTVR